MSLNKTLIIFLLLFLQPVLATDYQHLIGKSDIRNIEGAKGHTGILVANDPNMIGVTILHYKDTILFALEENRVVVSIFEAPLEKEGTLYTGGLCWVEGTRRPDIVFLVKIGERNQNFTEILRSWKVDIKLKRFIETKVKEARCVNNAYVD